jgi:cholesterol transport system auxiliary component
MHNSLRQKLTTASLLLSALLLSGLGLAGCGSLLPDTGPAPNIYTLRAATPAPDAPAVAWHLVVEEPLTSGHLNTDRIAVQPTPYELKYYPDARWSERAPAMVQRRMIEAFANSGKIGAVGSELLGLRADFRLKAELKEFAARFTDGASLPSAHVRMRLTLLGKSRDEVIGVYEIDQRAAAQSGKILDVVAAFDQALAGALAQAVDWTLRAQPTIEPPARAQPNEPAGKSGAPKSTAVPR